MPEPFSLDGMDQIPDPAAAAAEGPPPPARAPAERSATRADRRGLARAAMAFVLLWVAGALAVIGVRSDVVTPAVVAPIAAWVAGGAVALGVVLRPRGRGLPAGIRAIQHTVWIVPAAYVAGVVLIGVPGVEPVTWGSIKSCLGLSSLLTMGPLAAAAFLLRGSFLSAPGWRGAAVGGLSGLLGSAAIHAHCPCQAPSHLLAAHGTAIALGAVAGATLGRLGGRS
jgi:hypothetical protein